MTPRELTAWCLHSPRRLASIAALGSVLAFLVVSTLPGVSQPEPVTAPPGRAESSGSPSEPRRPAVAPAAETAASWPTVRGAAREFLAIYLSPSRPDSPRSRPGGGLRPLVTPSLWRGLALTSPGSFPRGRLVDVRPDSLGPFGADVGARLADGRGLSLALVVFEGRWRVSDVRPVDPAR